MKKKKGSRVFFRPTLFFDLNLSLSLSFSSSPLFLSSFSLLSLSLKKKFEWGVASSAFQSEGGNSKGGRSPSIWDAFIADKFGYVDGSPINSFEHWKEDVAVMKALGCKVYRFSISWARMFPDGGRGKVNEKAVEFYRGILSALHDAGIKALPTLYHFDLPLALQEEYGKIRFLKFCLLTGVEDIFQRKERRGTEKGKERKGRGKERKTRQTYSFLPSLQQQNNNSHSPPKAAGPPPRSSTTSATTPPPSSRSSAARARAKLPTFSR